MSIRVEILSGHASPWTGSFQQPSVTIGRDPSSDVKLHPTLDLQCARIAHATLLHHEGRWALVADHETGVVIVDGPHTGKKLANGESIELNAATQFTLGDGGPRIRTEPDYGELPVTASPQKVKQEDRPPEARMPVQVAEDATGSARRTKRNALIGAVLALAVVGVAAWALLNNIRINSLEERTNAAIQKLESGLEQQRRAALEEVDMSDRLTSIVASVCLLGLETTDGEFVPVGTGWTCADGVLATNAHVVQGIEDLLAGDLPNAKPIAKRGPDLEIRLELGDMVIHPAYEPWGQTFGSLSVGTGGRTRLLSPGDVATIQVTSGDAGAPIPLASSALEVRAGVALGYVGFPMENIAGLPSMQQFSGHATQVTDFFFQTDGAERFLLHHDLVATGGASGSPIINSKGEVVGLLCAGSVVFVPTAGGDIARSPVGLNYAQHVAMLVELLNGDAELQQAGRDARWRDQLGRATATVDNRIGSMVDYLVEVNGFDPDSLVPVEDLALDFATGEVLKSVEFECEPGVTYVFVAASDDWSDTDMAVVYGSETLTVDRDENPISVGFAEASRRGRTVEVNVALHRRLQSPCSVKVRVLRVAS